MFIFKPTLSKAYLTFLLSFPLFSPLLFLLVYALFANYDPSSSNVIFVFLIEFSSVTILACYIVVCVLAVLFARFWKRKGLWQPTFPKTILAVFFELSFIVAGFLFMQTDTGIHFLQILFPYNGFNPCPSTIGFSCKLDARVYVIWSIISLVNACISYTLSCFVTDFIKMKGIKIIRA